MDWSEVGGWLKDNAGTGATLVGSLLTGNAPGAISAGISLVSSATGTANPQEALAQLQSDPQTVVELKRLANQEKDSIRKHLEEMTRLQLEDDQKAHSETQTTIRNADNAEDKLVRWTRPGQSWVSLAMAGAYVFTADSLNVTILGLLLTLPWAYAGLRQVGKGIDSFKKPKP